MADLLDGPLSQVTGAAADNFRSLVAEFQIQQVALIFARGDETTSSAIKRANSYP